MLVVSFVHSFSAKGETRRDRIRAPRHYEVGRECIAPLFGSGLAFLLPRQFYEFPIVSYHASYRPHQHPSKKAGGVVDVALSSDDSFRRVWHGERTVVVG